MQHDAAAGSEIPVAFQRSRRQVQKLTECVLFILHQAVASERILSRDDITDVMFLADKAHLDEYGRYVVHDNHFALPHGPAGAELTQMLGAFYPWSDTTDVEAPWTVCGEGPQSMICMPTRACNTRKLSVSDLDALTAAFDIIDTCDTPLIESLVCGNAAYTTAIAHGAGQHVRMDPRYIMESPNGDLIDDLIFYSCHCG